MGPSGLRAGGSDVSRLFERPRAAKRARAAACRSSAEASSFNGAGAPTMLCPMRRHQTSRSRLRTMTIPPQAAHRNRTKGKSRPAFRPSVHRRRAGCLCRRASIPASRRCRLHASPVSATTRPDNICCLRKVDYFQRFVDSGIHPMTPREKGLLAFRNTIDPYNFATIGFFSAISVAENPNSAYGPGFPGFGRNFGVAFGENGIGEFFGTFLIPSITHQDPALSPHAERFLCAPHTARHHGRRMGAKRLWDRHAELLHSPRQRGRRRSRQSLRLGRDKVSAPPPRATPRLSPPIPSATSSREFVPDVARRVNIRIVLIQQIVNHVETAALIRTWRQ